MVSPNEVHDLQVKYQELECKKSALLEQLKDVELKQCEVTTALNLMVLEFTKSQKPNTSGIALPSDMKFNMKKDIH